MKKIVSFIILGSALFRRSYRNNDASPHQPSLADGGQS
jgi:hypothetical protein